MDDIKLGKAAAVLKRLGHQLQGTILFKRHHIIFKAEKNEIWICYPIILECARYGSKIRLVCKDFMFFTIDFRDDVQGINAFETIEELRHVSRVEKLYAFSYRPISSEKNFDGWSLYNAHKEYQRMGILNGSEKWRISEANREYQLCPTYPRDLVVPTVISDNVLQYAAKFRSKKRLPVLSYYLKLNECTISRCSQPLIGIKQARNMQDEAILSAIFGTTEGPSGLRGAQTDHLVVDLRPSTNAIAQVALGGGTENMERYKGARKVYMGVDNLHVVRESLMKVVDSLRHSDVGDEPPNPSSLERSQWLRHICTLINSSKIVVEQVYYKCSHVVVHCSDGWDRTPQITSLAMLCLDPYYRTFEGFMVLVEKEWVSFGHQFALRANIVDEKYGTPSDDESEEVTAHDIFKNVTQFLSETTKGRQEGPIFQQFLDCVYQLLMLFPSMFEFNERFLRRLLYHSYSCQYGTFLFNTEKDKCEHNAAGLTRSVWDYFLSRRSQFLNQGYQQPRENYEVLNIPADWKPRWWSASFGRMSDSDMNDPNAWKKKTMKKSSPAGLSESCSRLPQNLQLNTDENKSAVADASSSNRASSSVEKGKIIG